jgi:hypothetical protein
MEIFEGFLGVVKHHNITRADMLYHVVETSAGAQTSVIVSAQHVPHYDVIAFAQSACLFW